ncbi:hypothetical protein H0H81_003677 [Sphagnurus paluster]|uniref:Uncharacterized protein n=1 Tax=Sphagnurus paluster TaxID=117069 RepID=A0A9P7GHN6_9AGAR|nr:hypothetical protein H0H81_003677 [Sphagnurus paluster]
MSHSGCYSTVDNTEPLPELRMEEDPLTTSSGGHNQARRLVTIEDLPTELLLLIFKPIFLNPVDANPWKHRDRAFPREYDMRRSAYAFPYTLASVCSKWNNILRLANFFRTLVLIFIDDPLVIQHAKADLNIADNLTIVLTVTRRTADSFIDDPIAEHLIMKEVMEIITPHIPRCRKLRFDLAHTSSLPRLATDFQHPAPLLIALSMEAAVASGLGGLTSHTKSKLDYQSFPRLYELEIDGHNFVDVFRNEDTQNWLWEIRECGERFPVSLRIANYDPEAGSTPQGRFFVFEALSLFGAFNHLELDNLKFSHIARTAEESEIVDPESFAEIQGEYIRLSRLSAELTAVLMPQISTHYAHIIDCPLSHSTRLPSHDGLELRDINYTDTALDLCFLLPPWYGERLWVTNCAIDDTVLAILKKRSGPNEWNDFNASYLKQIRLRDCARVSERAVASLCWAREGKGGEDFIVVERPTDK